MNWVPLAGLISGLLYTTILIVKAAMSRAYLRSHREVEILRRPVTILQPILGGDPNLKSVLQSNLEMATAEARFWWLVEVPEVL